MLSRVRIHSETQSVLRTASKLLFDDPLRDPRVLHVECTA
jgi:hypothetical protein